MTTAIIEIAPHGHYTYVESMAKIYTALPENNVVIFTHEKGYTALQHLQNQQISIQIKQNREEYETFLQRVKNVDLVIVVTLEAYSKEPYHIMRQFIKIDFTCPVYYVIHNVDFWFQQSLSDKMRYIFYKIQDFNDFAYRLKVYFKYSLINPKIIEKVKKTNGKFGTLTESVATELAKYVGRDKVAVIPFSIFDNTIPDKSLDNQRIRVCIPGYVSAMRRDYHSIFQLFEADTEGVLKNAVEWDFLGGISPSLIEGGDAIKVIANQWIEKGYTIHIYDKPSVGLEEFDAQLAKADLVLGNMHLQQGANSRYGKTKETGLIFTMIKAAKVGLLPIQYPCEAQLKTSVLTFSDYKEITSILINLYRNRSKLYDLKKNALENSKKYTPLSIFHQLQM